MDDKRTLLAFLLVGLIFLLMPYYYEWMGLTPPPPEERPVQEAVTQERTPDPPTETTPRSHSTATLDRVEAEAPPAVTGAAGASRPTRTVVIGSHLQRMVLSTRGGAFLNAQLLEYRRPDGRIVDLIPPGAESLTVSLRSESNERIIDLRDLHFEPDADSV